MHFPSSSNAYTTVPYASRSNIEGQNFHHSKHKPPPTIP
jgi:hypothetical protein